MAHRYHIAGTNDFLVWAIILFAGAAWCMKDGWFPSEAKLTEHPREVEIKTSDAGMVKDVFVRQGLLIDSNQPIVRVTLAANVGESLLKTPVRGEIVNILVGKNDMVNKAQVVAVIAPEDNFYSFNKGMTIIALLGALVCAIIHFLVR